MPKTEFKNIHSILDSLLEKQAIFPQILNERFLNEWKEIIGKDLSKQCYPVKSEKNILFLKTKNSVWRNELNLRQLEIIDLITAYFGKKIITKIQFL